MDTSKKNVSNGSVGTSTVLLYMISDTAVEMLPEKNHTWSHSSNYQC